MTSSLARGLDAVARRLSQPVVERIMLAARGSRRPRLWTRTHAVLAVPFVTVGRTRRYYGKVDDEPVRATCVGREERFGEVLERVLGPADRLDGASRYVLWRQSALSRLDSDLTAAEVHPWAAPRYRRAGWIVVPETIRWRAATGDLPPSNPSKSLRSDLKKVAAGGYVFETAENPTANDWREFERELVVPLATRRFQGAASLPSRSVMRWLEARCALLFARSGAERVAGICLLRARDAVWMVVLGVREGSQELVERGVIAALYLATLERARAWSARWVDAGRTGPFRRDGLARWKRKWGFLPATDPMSHLIAIRARPEHATLARGLESELAFVATDRGLRDLRG